MTQTLDTAILLLGRLILTLILIPPSLNMRFTHGRIKNIASFKFRNIALRLDQFFTSFAVNDLPEIFNLHLRRLSLTVQHQPGCKFTVGSKLHPKISVRVPSFLQFLRLLGDTLNPYDPKHLSPLASKLNGKTDLSQVTQVRLERKNDLFKNSLNTIPQASESFFMESNPRREWSARTARKTRGIEGRFLPRQFPM